MIDQSKIKRNDIINVRDIGKAQIIDIDQSGKNNPYKRSAYKIKTESGKMMWIVPERVINDTSEKTRIIFITSCFSFVS